MALDAGEVLLSLRSRDLWDAVELDREVDEAGRISLLRRVREAGATLGRHLEQLIEGYLASARATTRESSRCSTASFWAAAIAIACMCTSAAIAVIAWS